MRVMELMGPGVENLRLVEKPTPKPGQGQVLVKMKAASLNYRDLITVRGLPGNRFPMVPLSDGCGEVVEVGPHVTRVKTGDRVATLFFQNWIGGEPSPEGMVSALGGALDGCFQDYMVLSEQGVSKVPAHLSDFEVATLPCAALTAWRSLVVEGHLKAGETVVAQGTGGVSIFALQFAKAHGAQVIITSSSDTKLARAKALGADHLINYKERPGWARVVREITHGRGADHVVEVGGAQTLGESLKAIRLGGHVSVVGVLSGFSEKVEIHHIFGQNARVIGVSIGNREGFEQMCRAIDLHKIKPVVDKVFPFAEAHQAFETMAGQSHFGKIVIDFAA
jgi:NADPH:quinone reductase-like Zn-dependent oxidoreductase